MTRSIRSDSNWGQFLRGRVSYLIIGLVVSAAAVVLILSRTPLGQIADRLRDVNPGWLAAMAAGKTVILLGKQRRWRRVLVAMRRGVYRATFRAVAAGYLVNLLVPLKAGELVRSGILSRHNAGVSVGDGLATVASERVLDAVILTSCAAVVLPWIEGPSWIQTGVGFFALTLLGVVVFLVTVPLHHGWVRQLEASSIGMLNRIHPLLHSLLQFVARGTSVWRSPSDLALAALWTTGIWLCEGAVVWMAVESVGVPLGYPSAMVITLLFTFGALIPSGPVQIGTHQALAVLFLAAFGVAEVSAAVAVSLVLQAVNLTVLAVAGIPAMLWESVSGHSVVPNEASEDEASRAPTA